MILFEDTKYNFEKKRLSLGVYEIKDSKKNLICQVKGDKAGKAFAIANFAATASGVIPIVGDVVDLTASTGIDYASKKSKSRLVFQTSDKRVHYEILKSKGFRKGSFDFNDSEGNRLATITYSSGLVGRKNFVLLDPNGKEIATTKSRRMKFEYNIKNGSQELAKMKKKNFKSMMTTRRCYDVEILSKSIDPAIILAFAVSIDVTEGKR